MKSILASGETESINEAQKRLTANLKSDDQQRKLTSENYQLGIGV